MNNALYNPADLYIYLKSIPSPLLYPFIAKGEFD